MGAPTEIGSWFGTELFYLRWREVREIHELAHLVLCPDDAVLLFDWGLGPVTPRGVTKAQWLDIEARVYDIETMIAEHAGLSFRRLRDFGKPVTLEYRRLKTRRHSRQWFRVNIATSDALIEDHLLRFPDIESIWAEVERKRALVVAGGGLRA